MALIIAGERSGVGKTTITLAILAFLTQQNNKIVQGFKIGPDYIDPMFHTALTKRYCRNLDPVLTSPDYVRSCFALHSSQADYVVVEGVMGLFDGITWENELNYASTAHIARLLNIPVLLILDCSSLSGSIAAIAHGYRTFDSQIAIAGVILNRVASDRHFELLEEALNSINLPILGVVKRHSEITIPDRHLGLIPTVELPEITKVFEKLAQIAKDFDWQKLLPLLQSTQKYYSRSDTEQAKARYAREFSSALSAPEKVKIAIAYDRAFNFYYQDNFDLLEQLGAELSFWSPLTAKNIPSDVSGFYFGGGFPEIFAEALAANTTVRQQLRQVISQNIPVYAECGGLMYLCAYLCDLQGKTWEMVGTIPATATMTSRLTLGYRQAFPLSASSLVPQTLSPHINTLWGHEFHRSQLNVMSPQPIWQLRSLSKHTQKVTEGWKIKRIHASYLHLHFGKSKYLLKRWLDCCRDHQN